MNQYFICDNFRTPFGSIGGFLSRINPSTLGSFLVHHLLDRNGDLNAEMISSLLVGNTLSSNFGPDFATQVVKESRLLNTVDRTLMDSGHITGLKLVDLASKTLNGAPGMVAAMGLENISSAPNYVPNELVKRYNEEANLPPLNGVLRDAYYVQEINNFSGQLAEQLCLANKVSREDLDAYVLESVEKTVEAAAAGKFASEICEVRFNVKDGHSFTFNEDQEYKRYEKTKDIKELDPAFTNDGRLTIASSARSADGGSIALIANEAALIEYGVTPKARIAGYAEVYGAAEDYVKSGVEASKAALKAAGIKTGDVDLFEVHEDFASTPLIYQKKMKLDADKMNKQGGSLGIGNPIGSTGLRLVNSLCNQFAQNGAKYGLATVCGPSGGSAALVLEKV